MKKDNTFVKLFKKTLFLSALFLSDSILVTHPVFVAKVLVLVLHGCAVDLGDADVRVAVEFLGQVVPNGGQFLAVAAPQK